MLFVFPYIEVISQKTKLMSIDQVRKSLKIELSFALQFFQQFVFFFVFPVCNAKIDQQWLKYGWVWMMKC